MTHPVSITVLGPYEAGMSASSIEQATDIGVVSESGNARAASWRQSVQLCTSFTPRGNVRPEEPVEDFDRDILYGKEARHWAAASRRALQRQWDEDHADGSEGW